ncbi:murein biosynthesis integral membrane protein MurJ [Candidatus Beckwithbacteria bacterium]|nr:murein biosynthesis integral membrane protein MurJ [Candidatus Beckwithbacteria bacterium]
MIKKWLFNGTNFFTQKQNSIISAAVVLMFTVLASRILGLVRDRLLSSTFFGGQEWQLDVYFAAFRIPDMIFQLLVMGALSAAFIPVFSSSLKHKIEEAWEITNGCINLASLVFIIFSVVVYIFAKPLSNLIAPEFNEQKIVLMVSLTRIMLLSQFFFIISNFFTGILQSNQRFLLPAIAPVLYNIGIIFGIIFLAPVYGIYGPVYGVVIGAFLHLIVQYPLVKKLGYHYKFVLGINLKGVRKIIKLMLPRTLGLGVNQIEYTFAVFLATGMAAGSLSIFYFSQHLQALPVGLFGLTFGQAALPMLSQEGENAEKSEKFKNLFSASLKQIFYFALPASVLLLVLRVPLVRIVFGAKEFPWEATLLTAKVVAAFSLSVVAQAAIQLLVRAFYAIQDTKTPLFIASLSVIINVFFSWFLVTQINLGVVGLGLAISLASLVQFLVLFFVLHQKVQCFNLFSL